MEIFNRTLREECLNEHWFSSLEEARQVIEGWRRRYNEERDHRGLAAMTPQEFAKKEEARRESGKVTNQNLTL